MTTLAFPEQQFRLRTAREIAAAGGSVDYCARRWQVGPAQARAWLRLYCPDFPVAHTPGRRQIPDALALERLRAIRHGLANGCSKQRLATDLGYSSAAALRRFIQTQAPDGLDAAIADLEAHLAPHERKSA